MAKFKPTKTVKKTPCGQQLRSRLMKAYESVIVELLLLGFIVKKVCLLCSSRYLPTKMINLLGYGEVNLRTAQDSLLEQG
jgi:hypothetical protein